MSDEFMASAGCSGDCAGCSSDCEGDFTQPTVTLTLDDDSEVKCAVIAIYPASNNQEYIALLPLDENGENQDGEVYLYRYMENENGQPNLANIESDEEYEIAAGSFEELSDLQDFEEYEDGEEE